MRIDITGYREVPIILDGLNKELIEKVIDLCLKELKNGD